MTIRIIWLIIYIITCHKYPFTDTHTNPSLSFNKRDTELLHFLPKMEETKKIQNFDIESKEIQVSIHVLIFINFKCWKFHELLISIEVMYRNLYLQMNRLMSILVLEHIPHSHTPPQSKVPITG